MVEDRLLKLPDVRERVRLSKAQIYKLVREGRFPSPRYVGRSAFWLASEVQAWILSTPTAPSRAA